MTRRLWISAMALVALVAAGGFKNKVVLADCYQPGSLCSNGQDCCSQKCLYITQFNQSYCQT